MNKKIVKKYIYKGLGFPIELHNVELIQFDGEFHPKIDVRKTADLAIKSFVTQKTRLTGNQIKFIRTYFSMSLRKFADLVNESHMAVKKWEAFKNDPTNMDRNIEIMLRLHIYDHIAVKAKNDKNMKIKFYNQFLVLTEMFSHPNFINKATIVQAQ
jgi:DNA-binding transcriptional regulator YiaG